MQHLSSLFSLRYLGLAAITAVTCLSASVAQAQSPAIITTGTAATASYHPGPIYRSSASSGYYYSQYAYLFDAAELTAAGITAGSAITQVEWEKTNAAATLRPGVFRILMKNSTQATYTTATPWATLTTGTTQVYNNAAQTLPATIGFVAFPLTAPFAYTGQSLELFTDWDNSVGTGNAATDAFNWAQYTVVDHILGYCNFAAITAPLSPSSNSIGTLDNLRPKIRITYTRTNGTRGQLLLSGEAYPNPTAGPIKLKLNPSFAGKKVELTVLDSTGRTLRTLLLPASGLLDLSDLAAGTYMVRASHNELTEVHRVQVAH